MNTAAFLDIVKNHPENFLYLFITEAQRKACFANNAVINNKIINQAVQGARMFAQAGISQEKAADILYNNIKAKYGLTPQQMLVQMARGKTPVPKFSTVGAIDDEEELLDIDPDTGLPLALFEQGAQTDEDLAMGRIGASDITLAYQQTTATPLPIIDASQPNFGSKVGFFYNSGRSAVFTGNAGTFQNIVDPLTGKTKYTLNCATGQTTGTYDEKTGKFKAGIAKFKEIWTEVASCTTEIKSLFADISSLLGELAQFILQIIKLCKNNGAVENVQWSPNEADCWDTAGVKQTNWGVIALLAGGVYYLTKN